MEWPFICDPLLRVHGRVQASHCMGSCVVYLDHDSQQFIIGLGVSDVEGKLWSEVTFFQRQRSADCLTEIRRLESSYADRC
jgi:hypothetical protein